MAKRSKYDAKCKVTMPKCSKYHAKSQVLVPNCCKYKANGTGKESQNKNPKPEAKKKSKNYSTPNIICIYTYLNAESLTHCAMHISSKTTSFRFIEVILMHRFLQAFKTFDSYLLFLSTGFSHISASIGRASLRVRFERLSAVVACSMY